MSLREEMWKYEQITGESAEHVPIIKLGAFLDGYEMGLNASEQQPSKDCISRTELLSRIDAERKHLLDIKMDGAEHIIVHHARRIIEDMPSVTPQPKTDGDCVSREAMMKCFKKWQPYMATRLWDYEQELKDLPSVNTQEPKTEWITKWIPVSERLPRIHQYILLSLKSLDIEVGFRAETEPYFYCHGHYIELQNVLAWVPLPIPYKESEGMPSEEPAFYDFRQSEKVKKCLVCDRYFSTTAGNAKYCSPECQQKAVRMKRKEWKEEHEHYYRDYFREKRAKDKEDNK